MRDQIPGFLGRLKPLVFPSEVAIPLTGWFLNYHKAFKLKVVFRSWERFHSKSNMWPRDGKEYRPHRTVILSALSQCDMFYNRWIDHDEFTVKIKQACWWVHGIYYID